LTDTKNLVDVNSLSNIQELLDTLKKYPNLQVDRVNVDQYSTDIICNEFYKGLKIFGTQYSLHKTHLGIFSSGTIVDAINSTLTPSVNYETAISIARNNMNFKNTCISYRLGFYYLTNGTQQTGNYKLAWVVQGENGAPYVYLDAVSGQVYEKFDGIEF